MLVVFSKNIYDYSFSSSALTDVLVRERISYAISRVSLRSILPAANETHPSAVSFRHIREGDPRDSYAFSKLHENTVFSRSIRQQTSSVKSDNKL